MTFKASGKRHIQVGISQNRKFLAKKVQNLKEEVMNIKARVKGKFGHVVQIQVCRLP